MTSRWIIRLLGSMAITSLMVSTPLYAKAKTKEFKPYSIPVEYKQEGGQLDDDMQRFIYRFCKEEGADYALILAMIETESGYHSEAVSSCGAVGYMQIMRDWQTKRMDILGVSDLLDPIGNVMVGIDYMAELTTQYPTALALMIYADGDDALKRWKNGVRGTSYTKVVLERTQRIMEELAMCEICHSTPCLGGCPNNPDADKIYCVECGEEISGDTGFYDSYKGAICEDCLEGYTVRELADLMCGGLEFAS